MKIGEIDPLDKRFWPVNPDPDFSPEKNKAVIEKSIAKYEAKRAKEKNKFVDQLRERTDAVASWLTSPHGAIGGNPLERYFSRRYLAHLRGKEIVERIQEKLRTIPGESKLPKIIDSKGNILGRNVQTKQKSKNPKKKRHTVIVR